MRKTETKHEQTNKCLKLLEKPAREIAKKVDSEQTSSDYQLTPENFLLINELEKNVDYLEHTGLNGGKLTIFKKLLLQELKNEIIFLFNNSQSLNSLARLRETVKATVDLGQAKYKDFGFEDSADFLEQLEEIKDIYNNFFQDRQNQIFLNNFLTGFLPNYEFSETDDWNLMDWDNWETNLSQAHQEEIDNLCDPNQANFFDLNFTNETSDKNYSKKSIADECQEILDKSAYPRSKKSKPMYISPTEKKFFDLTNKRVCHKGETKTLKLTNYDKF